jgi:pimeloyl-ACP methyl ester carboxylesterase
MLDLPTGRLRLLAGGSGEALAVLHHDIGNSGWLPFHEALARRFAVHAFDLPGYGQSERPVWARHPRDLAIVMNQALDSLGIERLHLVGLGFGGWVAAEMATMCQQRLATLTLVGAFGLRPERGQILDQMMMSHVDYVKAGFRSDAEFERHHGAEPDEDLALGWDLNKEMTARLAWKPYMFSHQLRPLLAGVRVPALVVWGREDRVAPLECGEIYVATLPNARLVVLEDTGHLVEVERPDELADLIAQSAAAREAPGRV